MSNHAAITLPDRDLVIAGLDYPWAQDDYAELSYHSFHFFASRVRFAKAEYTPVLTRKHPRFWLFLFNAAMPKSWFSTSLRTKS